MAERPFEGAFEKLDKVIKEVWAEIIRTIAEYHDALKSAKSEDEKERLKKIYGRRLREIYSKREKYIREWKRRIKQEVYKLK